MFDILYCYAANVDSYLPTFRDSLPDPIFKCEHSENIRAQKNWVFENWDEEGWTGFVWLRIETGGGRL